MRMGIGLGVGINRSNYAQGIFNAYSARVVADGGVVESGSCVDAVSSLLQSASFLLIPSGYKANKLYSEIPTNGNGDLTWTRTSTAIRTNSSSLLESMATGVPRLDYTYGSCPSALLEPQRTNLILQSQDFDNASWEKTRISVTANTTTSPDGTSNADTITATSTSTVLALQLITISSGTTYNTTFYVKQNTQRFIYIRFTSNAFNQNYVSVVFDLQDGTLGETSVGTTSGTLVSATATSSANGFYRITVIASISRTDGNVGIGFAAAKTGNTFNNFGTITSTITSGNSLFIYGAQLEAGAYPTTYIPTTSATATRVADSYTRDNIYTNGLITSSGGTWFVEFRNNIVYTRDNASSAFFINTGTSPALNDGFRIRNGGGSTRLLIDKIVASVPSTLYATTTDTVKLAIKWNGTSADIFANGTKVVSATAFTTTAMEYLNGTPQVPIFIQQMALFSTPLSDTDCTTITSI